jgi:hypothetical protein
MLTRLIEPFTELVRWGEPWDLEEEDPLLESSGQSDESFSLWS